MTMSGRISRSNLAAVLVLAVFFAFTAHALEIVNKQSRSLTVFVQPVCQPCTCPMIFCIRAPCIQNCQCPLMPCKEGAPCAQPECVCSRLCKILPGVVVEARASMALSVENVKFPLQFLTVEVKRLAYNVKAGDLKSINRNATVVVTSTSCGTTKHPGIVALVYRNPNFALYKRICLVRGERYGS